MASSPAQGITLSAEDRRLLDTWLEEFSRTWDEQQLAARVRRLPPAGTPLRQAALVALAARDLQQRWRHGRRVLVEAYLKAYPEVGTADTVPVSLLHAEYQARLEANLPGDLEGFTRRFPRQADELRQGLSATLALPTPRGIPGDDRTAQLPAGALTGDTPTTAAGPTQPLAAPPADIGQLPAQIGRYRIKKLLGTGGMGSVYLAHDSQLDRPVALKVPKFTGDDAAVALERFHREARAAATLNHPNICPVYEIGEDRGTHYLAMAFVEGRTLAQVLDPGKRLPQRQAAVLLRKVALALIEAHKRGILHRDLKPSNIMINQRSEPVIMDFGLARRVNAQDARLTREGMLLGTPAYMPPEAISGDGPEPGPPADIYSLGVILYEMLAGRLPFEGTATQVICRIMVDEPPRLSQFRPDVEPALEAICHKAMARKVEDRYPRMGPLAAALYDYLTGEATVADQPAASDEDASAVTEPEAEAAPPAAEEPPTRRSSGQRARPRKVRYARRRKRPAPWLFIGGGAGLIALLSIIGLAVWHPWTTGNGAATPSQSAQSPAERAQPRLREAQAALDRQDYDGAFAALNDALREDPQSAQAHVLIAAVHHERGRQEAHNKDYDHALADYGESLRLVAAQAPVLADRALLYCEQKQYDPALADAEAALKADPQNAAAHCARGMVYAGRKDFGKALDDFNEAVRLDKRLAPAYYQRGLVFAQQKALEKALEDLDQAVELEKANPDFLAARGDLHLEQKDYLSAISDYGLVIQAQPRSADVYRRRGNAYRDKAVWGDAFSDYDTAVRLDPENVAAHLDRGRAHDLHNEREPALADYTEAIRLNDKLEPAYRWRGFLYWRGKDAKDKDRARQDFEKALQLDPKDAFAHYGLGSVYDAHGELDKAFTEFDTALKLNESYWLAADLRADVLRKQRKFDEAIEGFTRALKLQPTNAYALYHRGLTYAAKGDDDKAIEDYSAAIAQNTQSAEAYRERGNAYRRKKDYNKALSSYALSLERAKEPITYAERAAAYVATREYDKAIEDCNKALAVNSDLARAYWVRGLAYKGLGNPVKADEDARRARDIDPDVGKSDKP
jgi:tetratricopeptide (TPR) repeat protein/predicted Ser/Thr protein kinase